MVQSMLQGEGRAKGQLCLFQLICLLKSLSGSSFFFGPKVGLPIGDGPYNP